MLLLILGSNCLIAWPLMGRVFPRCQLSAGCIAMEFRLRWIVNGLGYWEMSSEH
jgi:hypothetical protein